MTSYRDRIVALRRVRARDLIPHPKNWRTHPDRQRKALEGLLREVGYADALLVRETPDGLQLVDGHLRATADQVVAWVERTRRSTPGGLGRLQSVSVVDQAARIVPAWKRSGVSIEQIGILVGPLRTTRHLVGAASDEETDDG